MLWVFHHWYLPAFSENPELYLESLRAKHKELSERIEQRKRLKTNGSKTNGSQNLNGAGGRGERLNAAQRERMRLLTTAAFDRGKGEDTFGARDEDWQLYKLMSRDNDDEEDEEDEAELARVTSRLQVSLSISSFFDFLPAIFLVDEETYGNASSDIYLL